ncbi:F-actin-capping protein subunit alpha [Naematelia encephala]|uniref:F-actin-capping protein subunit alpha n=1 Tax=Naematelia encephala TaxID=71784 RepID=A0A1Y2B0A8_9TREE|nr:F-actin-capping protein subunit alpha [Naematelia encephala]
MAELSLEEKCNLASKLVEQAPPGQVNDVINDIRAIIGNDEALMPYIRPALRTYILTQLTVVEHPASGDVPVHTSLLSEATILPGSTAEKERFIDAEGGRSFAFDHINMTISEYEPYELPAEEAAFRAELAKSLAAYCKNHFPSGSSSVSSSQYPLLPPAPPAPVPAPVSEEPVTDVVPEQLNTGDAEPAPTPAVGDVEVKQEEVVAPGGLEKLDEEVEKAKEEEEGTEAASVPESTKPVVEESSEAASVPEATKPEVTEEPGSEEAAKVEEEPAAAAETAKVEDEPTEAGEPAAEAPEVPEPPAQATEAVEPAPPAVEQRKQERIENPTYTLEIVGNRYNTANFWTGRWRTRWVVDQAAGTVSGTINVDVHYYEQGNVQLATNHTSIFPLPTEATGSQSIASQIVTTISKIETTYHLELNDVYGELGDKVFRGLRRALPVTRQKMEWEKVSGYTLGSDLTKARA